MSARDRGDAGTLVLSELYTSLQGEGTRTGRPCVFVRLTGCGLRCSWCDTAWAFQGGERTPLEEVVRRVRAAGIPLVLLTGGEPLEQPGCFPLARALCDAGLEVTVETGGHVDTSPLDERVVRIVDVKLPGSGMAARNLWSNLDRLRAEDEVKFVVRDRADMEEAWRVIERHGLVAKRSPLLFSPVHGDLGPETLAAWLLERPLPTARMNLQLHKVVWPGRDRGV